MGGLRKRLSLRALLQTFIMVIASLDHIELISGGMFELVAEFLVDYHNYRLTFWYFIQSWKSGYWGEVCS